MDIRKVKSRQALQRALLTLLDQKALDDISVRELTDLAGVGYATFFRHYPALDDLLRDIAGEAVGPLLERGLPLLFGDAREDAAHALVNHVAENRKLWTQLLSQGGGSVLREQFGNAARALAEQSPQGAGKLPPGLRAHFGVRGAVDIIAWWLLRRPHLSEGEIVEFLVQLVIEPTSK